MCEISGQRLQIDLQIDFPTQDFILKFDMKNKRLQIRSTKNFSQRESLPSLTTARTSLLVLTLALPFFLTDCGKIPGLDGTPASGTFGSVYRTITTANCTQCHVPGGAATTDSGVQLDFTSQATAYSTLTSLNVTATSSKNICNGVKIVKSGEPAKSYFAAVLISTYNTSNFAGVTGCTPYNVHLENQNLSEAEKTSIVSWIQNGAPNN